MRVTKRRVPSVGYRGEVVKSPMEGFSQPLNQSKTTTKISATKSKYKQLTT